MDKKELDWSNLTFDYTETDASYYADFIDGQWSEGKITSDHTITLNEGASIFQYCQECFEGLKTYETVDGSIVVFRPEENAKRMADSALGLSMPPYPIKDFLKGIDEVVKANLSYVPPYGTGASLYLRPIMIGTTPVIGVKPSKEYQFRIIATPVGPYFKNGIKPVSLLVTDYDRAAPNGTGHLKAGLNYAMSMKAYSIAKSKGFDENLYLDAATRTYVEESGGANIIFVTEDNKVVSPKSDTILPSVVKRSLLVVARDYLGLETEERPVRIDEVKNFKEAGLCGTGAVISPVGRIVNGNEEILLPSGMEKIGPIMKKLYDTLTDIQGGVIEAPNGWLRKIK